MIPYGTIFQNISPGYQFESCNIALSCIKTESGLLIGKNRGYKQYNISILTVVIVTAEDARISASTNDYQHPNR